MATMTEPGAPTSANTSTTHPFTCNTCLIAFRAADPQRVHMRSDWHRYNLKRRIASLPPLTSEIFNEKVLANQAATAATAARANFEKTCPACNRTYYSDNAFANHLGSQKHKAKLEELARGHKGLGGGMEESVASLTTGSFSLGTPMGDVASLASGVESVSEAAASDDEVDEDLVSGLAERVQKANLKQTASEIDAEDDKASDAPSSQIQVASGPEACLFCKNVSPSLDSNIVHMRTLHGLFIPEPNYLVDLEGLIQWLHERVDVLHECLYCGMTRHSTGGIKTHMRDKGHCKIAFEDEEQMVEVGQFYDFSSTYSDDEDGDGDGEWEDSDEDSDEDEIETAKCNAGKLGASRTAATVEEDGDGEDWEDDEDSDEDMPDKTLSASKPKRNTPRAAEPQAIYHDEDGLHLPSGRIAGHRSLSRYFRQNLRTYPTPEERSSRLAITNSEAGDDDGNRDRDATPKPRGRHSNALVSRANGGLGMMGVSETGKKEAKKLEVKERKRQDRAQKRYQWGNERRNNFQKHFRDPLLQ